MFLLRETPRGHESTAFVCCFPSGFDPSEKLGRLLSEIHGPVPGYDRIAASMERFFGKLEVGRSVKRMNVRMATPLSSEKLSPFLLKRLVCADICHQLVVCPDARPALQLQGQPHSRRRRLVHARRTSRHLQGMPLHLRP